MNQHLLADSFDYSQITENIYVGSNLCCVTHFDEELVAEGITSVISLERERSDAAAGAEMHLWLPTIDNTSPSQDQLSLGVKTIQEFVRQKRKVYVHCRLGHGRAPTLVAAYLISQGKTVEEATKLVQEKRPVVHFNDLQISGLNEFARNNAR